MARRKRAKTRGGAKFDRFISTAKRMRPYPTIEVGFLDSDIAPLAFAHEFGNARAHLPERPAFRMALPRLERMCKAYWHRPSIRPYKYNKANGAMATDVEAFEKLADWLKKEYLTFEGDPLSAWQGRRKEGTPGESKQLVGHRGPKMIERIDWRLV